MRTLDQIAEDGRPTVVFSNGTEFSAWAGKWCLRCRQGYETCPLVDAAFLGFLPSEGVPKKARHDYRCKAFVKVDDGQTVVVV